MEFSRVEARIFHGYSFVEVTWLFGQEAAGADATVEILRSEQEKGPFKVRGKVSAQDYRYEDNLGRARGGRHPWYYRLILYRPGYPAIVSRVFSDSKFKSAQQESVFAAILARQLNQLRHRSGTPCLLFRRIVDGPVCPECTDASTGQSAGTSRCETCYGTGVEGGYAAPLETYVQKVTAPPFKEIKSQGGIPTKLEVDTVFATPALPRIYPGDLYLFSNSDERFEVGPGVQMPSMLGRHPIEHQFNAKKVPTDSVIYRIPVPEGW